MTYTQRTKYDSTIVYMENYKKFVIVIHVTIYLTLTLFLTTINDKISMSSVMYSIINLKLKRAHCLSFARGSIILFFRID